MTDHGFFRNDSPCGAWRAFAEADAQLKAPPHLEQRVLAALQNTHPPKRHTPAHIGTVWMAAAATLVLAFGFGFGVGQIINVLQSNAPSTATTATSTPKTNPDAVDEPPSVLDAAVPLPAGDLPRVAMDASTRTTSPGPRFAADPRRATESLQMLRVRLPRGVLQTLGVTFTPDDGADVIDVDVLIGEDGLPREIRPLRRSQE